MVIKDFGPAVVRIWEDLRPVTKKMIAGALDAGQSSHTPPSQKFSYDAHADWEVSRLLSALDEQSRTAEPDNAKTLNEIAELAETCVRVLEEQSGSAEVFIQLAERALKAQDYARLDRLSDHLLERFSTAEIAEIVRQTTVPQIRAIAYETLSFLTVDALVPLLDDPLYSEIILGALEQKAYEYESEEAREALDHFFPDQGFPVD